MSLSIEFIIDESRLVILNRDEYHQFKKNKKYKLDKDYSYCFARDQFGKFCGCYYFRLNDWELGRDDREKRANELFELLKENNLIPKNEKPKKKI